MFLYYINIEICIYYIISKKYINILGVYNLNKLELSLIIFISYLLSVRLVI